MLLITLTVSELLGFTGPEARSKQEDGQANLRVSQLSRIPWT